MAGFRDGYYKENYRVGVYMALYSNGQVQFYDRDHNPNELRLLIHTGIPLYFVKWGTKIDTMMSVLPQLLKNERHKNFIRVKIEELRK